MKKAFLYGIKPAIAILLLQVSSSALAFTLIEIPDSDTAPSSSITESTTFNSQLQPVLSAIQSHILDSRRNKKTEKSAQQGNVLASNGYAETMSDAYFIKVSSHDSNSSGNSRSLWLNSTFTSFDNDFSRTKYDGGMQMLLVGFDYTLADRYIFGVAVSYEASDIDTAFNTGNQETDGFSINPYFAYLISDTWSVDLSIGFGDFDTDQYRSVGAIDPGPPVGIVADTVDSNFSSDRDFVASNLTYSTPRGNWYLTGWLGFLLANKDQDSYTESDSTEIKGDDLDTERWSLGGEAAYGQDASETYVSLIYEKDNDRNEIEFATGEQPANDDDSMLLSIGWRYYGGDLVANIEFSSRQGADDLTENTISSTLRIDL